MARGRGTLGALALAGITYSTLVRPRLLRWGATDEELTRPFPGDDLVQGGKRSTTMAVTIDASPDQVWPWLAQLGSGRAGWYTWDLLDNGGKKSARAVHPEWQDLKVGDRLKFSVLGAGLVDAYEVAVLQPNQFLGLYGLSDLRGRWLDPKQPRPKCYMEGLWGFQLIELDGRHTRLVVSGYQTIRPRWVERTETYWLYPLIVWIMEAHMLKVLKRNIEAAARRSSPVASATGVLSGVEGGT